MRKIRNKRRGTAQSILEYVIILSAVILGILAMSTRMKQMVAKGLSDTADTYNQTTEQYKARMTVDAPPPTAQ